MLSNDSEMITENKQVILIGMMGCGKSTVGRALAEELKRCFYDTDTLIIEATGMTIADYIGKYGEVDFRHREREVLQQALAQEAPQVLATGGGVVLAADNRRDLRAAGLVLYLQVGVARLHERVEATLAERPLLAGVEGERLKKRISDLLAAREQYYRQTAHEVIEECATVAETVQAIIAVLNRHSHR